MALNITHKYDDILHLPRPESRRRSRMSSYDRAAQFSPFAALTGFDETIAETARLTDTRIELDENEKSRLDAALRQIRERFPACPRATVTWFTYDLCKSGGVYRTETVCIKKFIPEGGRLLLTDGREIPVEEIIDLELPDDPGTPVSDVLEESRKF